MSTRVLRHRESNVVMSESHLDAMAMFLRVSTHVALYRNLRREIRQRFRGAAWEYITSEMARRGIRL